MIESFHEIFSTSSEKAKLISILISVVMAIFILLLNQWFTSRREKRKIISSKIEEMYLASIEYCNATNKIISGLVQSSKNSENNDHNFDRVAHEAMNNSILKMEMLCGLYFQDIKFSSSHYSSAVIPIVSAIFEGKVENDIDFFHVYEESCELLRTRDKELKSMCKALMLRNMI
jgi:hypothetical protein